MTFFSCHAVPLEIRTRGPQALEAYRRALESGKCCDRRVPVMIVGQGRAGKTSLLKSLKGEKFKKKENTTDGIETWSFTKNVWRAGEWADGDSDERFARAAAKITSENLKTQSHERVARGDETLECNSAEAAPIARSSKEASDALPPAVEKAITTSRTEDSETDPELIFWDFAGQALFYTTHPFFLSRKAIYILTFDLGKGLDEKAESVVMIDEYEEVVQDNDCGMTNMDYIHYWLSSIQTFSEDDSSESTSDELPEKLPPVFLVGTHADECADCEEVFKQIRKKLDGRPYEEHVMVDFFAVNNTLSGTDKKDEQVEKLRKQIVEVARHLPHTTDNIPLVYVSRFLFKSFLFLVPSLAKLCILLFTSFYATLLGFLGIRGEFEVQGVYWSKIGGRQCRSRCSELSQLHWWGLVLGCDVLRNAMQADNLLNWIDAFCPFQVAQFRKGSASLGDRQGHKVHGSKYGKPGDMQALRSPRKQQLENRGRLFPWPPCDLALRYDAGTEPTGGAQSSVAHRPFQGRNHRETEELSKKESRQGYQGPLESPWRWEPPSWPCEACLERPHTGGRDYWQSLGDAPEVQRYLQEKNGRRAGIASILWTTYYAPTVLQMEVCFASEWPWTPMTAAKCIWTLEIMPTSLLKAIWSQMLGQKRTFNWLTSGLPKSPETHDPNDLILTYFVARSWRASTYQLWPAKKERGPLEGSRVFSVVWLRQFR